jgi:hypothetical protein
VAKTATEFCLIFVLPNPRLQRVYLPFFHTILSIYDLYNLVPLAILEWKSSDSPNGTPKKGSARKGSKTVSHRDTTTTAVASASATSMDIGEFIEQLTYTSKTNVANISEICCDILCRIICKETPPRSLIVAMRDCHRNLSAAFSDYDCLIIVKNIFCTSIICPIVATPWNYGVLFGASMDASSRAVLLFAGDCIRKICDGTLLIEFGELLTSEQAARVSSVGTAFDEWIAGMAFPFLSPRMGFSAGSARVMQSAAAEQSQCPTDSRTESRQLRWENSESSEDMLTSMAVEIDHDTVPLPRFASAPIVPVKRSAPSSPSTSRKPNFVPIHMLAMQRRRKTTLLPLHASSSDHSGDDVQVHPLGFVTDSETEDTDSDSNDSYESQVQVNINRSLMSMEMDTVSEGKGSPSASVSSSAADLPEFDSEKERLDTAIMNYQLTTVFGQKSTLRQVVSDTQFTVLMLVRNLGCAVTRQNVSKMSDWTNMLAAHGAQMVCIASGEGGRAASSFRESTGFSGNIVLDSQVKEGIFDLFGCLRGWKRALFNVKSLRALGSAVAAGFKQGSGPGDRRQLGGVIIVDREGTVIMKHLETFAGETVMAQQILRALGAEEQDISKWVPEDDKRSKSVPRRVGESNNKARGRSTSISAK